MRSYGLPYKGSKRRHCEEIIRLIPPCDRFIDACAGGGAVAECAALSGKFKDVTAVELIPGQARLLEYMLLGKGSINERQLILGEREDFFLSLDRYGETDCTLDEAASVAVLCFGGDMRTYLYGEPHGSFKRLASRMLTENDLYRRIAHYYKLLEIIYARKGWKDRQEFDCFKRLDHIVRLRRILSKRGNRYYSKNHVINGSLFDVDYSQYDVIFFDPPYPGTSGYGKKGGAAEKNFDFPRFWELLDSIEKPVLMTTPTCEAKKYEVIKEWDIKTTLSASGSCKSMEEKLWANKAGVELTAETRQNESSCFTKQLSFNLDEGEISGADISA